MASAVADLAQMAAALELDDVRAVRERCARCQRPAPVCVCIALPPEGPLTLHTKVVVLQHPEEFHKRTIGTVPLVQLCLAQCDIFVAELGLVDGDPAADSGWLYNPKQCNTSHHTVMRFAPPVQAALDVVLSTPGTLLLYPGPGAVDIETLPLVAGADSRTLVVVDGTWGQASFMMRACNAMIHAAVAKGTVQRVQFAAAGSSGYRFRKEPAAHCLSTLESISYSLRFLDAQGAVAERFLLSAYVIDRCSYLVCACVGVLWVFLIVGWCLLVLVGAARRG
jgi:DTW domain-containing protein YfiP